MPIETNREDTSSVDLKFLEGRLAKYILNEHQRNQAISLFIHGVDKAEIFRILSHHKGVPKSHASGKYKEGKVKHS